ncbi:aminotransferase class I/II-fold pyridoxal phosphate-dependent enzyme [Streptomyces sp. PTY087I2]|uniref:aminotransferase class I/II-fold pyridoxal phosphate-dependent enzyme n=1 Tax=Streptomyces sp. PTY087I2 TaxID=1819298 RepID=UPI000827DCCA|nr:aminotransferase class I/II-fold pyridoxal phosphate-dependent enzyme [Streptomyces sp. PTY087I2]OCC10563.1 L-glutamine:scyllo-inosose aminotransferase [Streptomyces sp. PTY087I2]
MNDDTTSGRPAVRPRSGWPGWPVTDERSAQALVLPLLSGRLAVSGARSAWPSANRRAARALAEMSGREHAVLTTNGSSAIVVALHALGIGPGDTVAMPATTWVSCATAVFRVGARPVYFDATELSPCGSADALDQAPSAILAVHLYAQTFDVARARARWPGVPVIEDMSHCQFGPAADGSALGGSSDLSLMSLQATKTITCGEGGAVLTDDADLAARLESLVKDSRRLAESPEPAAPNELEPARLLHGANHALAETSASLLIDQLARFPEQAARRAKAADGFVAALTGRGWEVPADPGILAAGTFYGLALRIPRGTRGPAELIDTVYERTGVTLDRVYPPVPEGPLYLPSTVKQYAELPAESFSAPLSRRWHESGVVVPHPVFLAEPERIEELARVLDEAATTSGRPARRGLDGVPRAGEGSSESPAPSPVTVDVVVITKGERPTLGKALRSILAQETDAEVRTTLWLDGFGTALPPLPEALKARVIRIDEQDSSVAHPFDRIAVLRDLAVRRTSADFVAFLDDDNEWEPTHLASLLEAAEPGLPAVHSWRTLIDAQSRPTGVTRFPWLPGGEPSLARFEDLRSVGVMDDGPVVRDSTAFTLPDGTRGMVDMGEWLFDRRLLRLLNFHRTRTPQEMEDRITEDDILLEQLMALGVPVGCTYRPTLRYRLGGMTTREYAQPV